MQRVPGAAGGAAVARGAEVFDGAELADVGDGAALDAGEDTPLVLDPAEGDAGRDEAPLVAEAGVDDDATRMLLTSAVEVDVVSPLPPHPVSAIADTIATVMVTLRPRMMPPRSRDVLPWARQDRSLHTP